MVSKISLVVPVYNESENLESFYKAIQSTMESLRDYSWEIVFINDGSLDDSWLKIITLSNLDDRIKGVCLSRNFGKEIALSAGVDQVGDADAVIFIDADLQHPPELIPQMVDRWREGYQIVSAVRTDINHTLIRKIGAKLFYFILNRFSNISLTPNSTDFRLLDQHVIRVFQTFEERTRFFRGMIDWMGFSKIALEFTSPDRVGGDSSFNFSRLVRLALNSITSFSFLPLRIAGYLGVGITSFTFFLLIYMLISDNYMGYTPQAYFAVLNAFLSGIILTALGLIAMYIAHIHTEVIRRPLYIVKEKIGGGNKKGIVMLDDL